MEDNEVSPAIIPSLSSFYRDLCNDFEDRSSQKPLCENQNVVDLKLFNVLEVVLHFFI
jgi:hypothetical protein